MINKISIMLKKLVTYVYLILTNYHGRRHRKSFGKNNNEKIYYLIRPRTNCVEGLMSLTCNVLNEIAYADENGMIPVVDMKNYRTQYYEKDKNIWENYYKQVSKTDLEDVYSSKNVVFSGYTLNNCINKGIFFEELLFDNNKFSYCQKIFNKYILFSNPVNELAKKEYEKYENKRVLGVYLRGTDYVKLKPKGHFVQPSSEELSTYIDDFLKEKDVDIIFLVTEDKEIYEYFKIKYQDKISITSYDRFIDKYDGKQLLYKSDVFKENNYEKGLHYLVKLILLSKCNYLISSITSATGIVKLMNNGKYEYELYINKGVYK